MKNYILSIILFFFYIICSDAAQASGATVKKLCYVQSEHVQVPHILVSSGAFSQAIAIRKNRMLQNRKIVLSNKNGDSLFQKNFLNYGDCLLLNLDEKINLEVYEEQNTLDKKLAESAFLPVIYFMHKDKSKHYGLVDKKQLQKLTVSREHQETKTKTIINYTNNTADNLFLIYITCPADRNSLCDLKIKENGRWLKDEKTGTELNLKVLARSQRENNISGKSQRTHINSDTPQGLYYIWGAVTGGGYSTWHRLARLDLDAALPPINGQSYNIHSHLLSKIVPDTALDDYWLNEWPLAYSLGRIFLRIAPGDLETKQDAKSAISGYNATEGCINTGSNHKKLLKILVDAGIFTQDEVFAKAELLAAKQWHVTRKLGKALVIIKDQD